MPNYISEKEVVNIKLILTVKTTLLLTGTSIHHKKKLYFNVIFCKKDGNTMMALWLLQRLHNWMI